MFGKRRPPGAGWFVIYFDEVFRMIGPFISEALSVSDVHSVRDNFF